MSLSIKQLTEDPWSATEKSFLESRHMGTVYIYYQVYYIDFQQYW
jgi:ribosomal protein S1